MHLPWFPTLEVNCRRVSFYSFSTFIASIVSGVVKWLTGLGLLRPPKFRNRLTALKTTG